MAWQIIFLAGEWMRGVADACMPHLLAPLTR
jgi:hypothetical protein